MNARLRALAWPALVVAGALLPLLPGLLPGRTLAWRDTALLHAPLRAHVASTLRQGRLPLWEPWEGAGQPLHAQALHSVLHPVAVAVAAFTDSIDALLAALVVCAALGAWAAARTLGAGAAAASVAAFGYGLSGYALGMTSNAQYLVGTATLPWVVAGLRHAATSQGGWLAAAAAVAAAGLTGDPGALAAGLVAGLALAVEGGGWRGLARAGGGALLGVAGGAAQLVPTWAYLQTTLRSAPGAASRAPEQWSLDLVRLPELVSPGLFVGLPRSYSAPVFAVLGNPAEAPFPWAPSVFVGAPLLLLAALAARSGRTARVVAGLGALFLWISLGRQAGASQLLQALPVVGVIRYWEKMVAPLTLCVALAAALGVRALAVEGARWLAPRAAGAAVLALAGAGAVWLWRTHPGSAASLYQSRISLGLGFAAATLAGLAALAAWARKGQRDAAAGLAALAFVQAAAASPFALHHGDAAALARRPPALRADPPGPRILAPVVRNFEGPAGHRDAIDASHAYRYRMGQPATNAAAGVSSAWTYTGFGSVRFATVAGAGRLRWPMMRRLGTTHVVAPDPVDSDDRVVTSLALGPGAGPPAREQDGVSAWPVAHRPWATFAGAVRIAANVRSAARALGEEMAAGRDTVVVESPSVPPVSAGRVLAVERRAEDVVVEAESDGPGLLVVNDAWAPGWTAEIDGASVPIWPADVLVRAVQWPAGRHRLVMRYDPPEVALGVGITAAASAGALAAFLLSTRRRRRPA